MLDIGCTELPQQIVRSRICLSPSEPAPRNKPDQARPSSNSGSLRAGQVGQRCFASILLCGPVFQLLCLALCNCALRALLASLCILTTSLVYPILPNIGIQHRLCPARCCAMYLTQGTGCTADSPVRLGARVFVRLAVNPSIRPFACPSAHLLIAPHLPIQPMSILRLPPWPSLSGLPSASAAPHMLPACLSLVWVCGGYGARSMGHAVIDLCLVL